MRQSVSDVAQILHSFAFKASYFNYNDVGYFCIDGWSHERPILRLETFFNLRLGSSVHFTQYFMNSS